jgi:glycosyltransferase involved in cell wall biosynthesis
MDPRVMLRYPDMQRYGVSVEFHLAGGIQMLMQQKGRDLARRILSRLSLANDLRYPWQDRLFHSFRVPPNLLKRVQPHLLLAYAALPRLPDSSRNVPIFLTGGFMSDTFIARKFGARHVPRVRAEHVRMIRWKVERVAVYHSVSDTSTSLGKQYMPDLAAKFITIPFFLPYLKCGPEDEFAGKWRQERRRALFVGRQALRKGLPCLLKAWGRLPTELRRNTELTIVSTFDDGYLDVAGAGLSGITVKRGLPRDADVLGEMRRSHFFILPSVEEAYGLVFIEAMASGCAVLGPDSEVQNELVVGNGAGLVANPLDEDDLFSKLLQLLQPSAPALQWATNGRSAFITRYAPDVVARRYAEAWEGLARAGTSHACCQRA